ncbi:Uncharacterized protein NEOC65_002418 [Neochlamydia sp. AcF65]|nr:Uncharacterized protein [Neochlamydia sp. AcF65]MBS4169723.1 Uncharacterized protein [Neochlamydia sp. AcF95]
MLYMFFKQNRGKTQNVQENIREKLLKPLSLEIVEYRTLLENFSLTFAEK